MRVEITCPFTLPGSHEIHGIGFKGGNKTELETPFHLDNFLGRVGTNLDIINNGKGEYSIKINSDSLSEEKEQIGFLEKVSEYLSFLINTGESSPHYGTNFIKLDWFNFKATATQEDKKPLQATLHLSETLTISSTRTVKLEEAVVKKGSYHEILRFYYDGLRAEHAKSKYFHWFLILERLENSEKYRTLFNSNKLFDENETSIITEAAGKMSSPAKKAAITTLLSRTKEFRNYKLCNLITRLGITEVACTGTTTKVSEAMIKTIIDGRNSLFHSGKEFPEWALWGSLFPLATQIVETVSNNSTCLDA